MTPTPKSIGLPQGPAPHPVSTRYASLPRVLTSGADILGELRALRCSLPHTRLQALQSCAASGSLPGVLFSRTATPRLASTCDGPHCPSPPVLALQGSPRSQFLSTKYLPGHRTECVYPASSERQKGLPWQLTTPVAVCSSSSVTTPGPIQTRHRCLPAAHAPLSPGKPPSSTKSAASPTRFRSCSLGSPRRSSMPRPILWGPASNQVLPKRRGAGPVCPGPPARQDPLPR